MGYISNEIRNIPWYIGYILWLEAGLSKLNNASFSNYNCLSDWNPSFLKMSTDLPGIPALTVQLHIILLAQ